MLSLFTRHQADVSRNIVHNGMSLISSQRCVLVPYTCPRPWATKFKIAKLWCMYVNSMLALGRVIRSSLETRGRSSFGLRLIFVKKYLLASETRLPIEDRVSLEYSIHQQGSAERARILSLTRSKLGQEDQNRYLPWTVNITTFPW